VATPAVHTWSDRDDLFIFEAFQTAVDTMRDLLRGCYGFLSRDRE